MACLAAAFVLCPAVAAASGEQIVFVVRHAERVDGGSPSSGSGMIAAPDPDLSPAGHARAERLAKLVRAAGIARVYATEFKRTQQTARPTADAAGIDITVVSSKDTAALIRRLESDSTAAPGPALVVGHSNTVPAILKALGVSRPVVVEDDEYDSLFVVVRGTGGQATMVVLKY